MNQFFSHLPQLPECLLSLILESRAGYKAPHKSYLVF